MRFFERIASVLWLIIAYFWLLPQLIWAGWKISRLGTFCAGNGGASRLM